MLAQRVITALVIGVALLGALLFATIEVLAWVFFTVSALAAHEWSQLVGIKQGLQKLVYVCVVIAVVGLFIWRPEFAEYRLFIAYASAALWVGIVIYLVKYQASGGKIDVYRSMLMGMGIIILGATGVSLLAIRELHPHGQVLLIGLFVLVSAADSGAYFSGKAFGKHKLAPALSPGKSIEGVIGGVLFSSLLAGALAWYLDADLPRITWWILAWIPVALISVAGDLFESLLKRTAGVKDSGKILPGHGGILDRIDSHVAAAPFYLLISYWVF